MSFVVLFSICIVSGCNGANTISNAENAVNTANNTQTENIQEQKEFTPTVNNPQNADLQANQTNKISFAVESDDA